VLSRPCSTIEDIFLDYFADQDLATDPTAFDGRSDYGPFIDVSATWSTPGSHNVKRRRRT
jgi:hypothetical protein